MNFPEEDFNYRDYSHFKFIVMNKRDRDFNALISNAADYLKLKLGYTIWTIGHRKTNWNQIKKFMVSNGIKCYSEDVEKQILYYKFKDRNMRELSRTEKEFYNSVKMLSEFQVTGKIKVYPRMDRKSFVFSGPIGEIVANFLSYKIVEQRLSTVRIHCYQRYLFQFLNHCNNKGIRSITEIDLAFILHYIGELDCKKGTPVYMIISTLRGFIKYAFDQKLLDVDYSIKIPKYRSVNQPKLPSTYSKEEIEKLIASVERSSAIGKRNYAIILIAAKLGLRASDISRLKFDNLHWDSSTIEINQYKTGKELTLPLLADVGNAIVDYLKYGRPLSDEPYVFLTGRPPHGHFPTSNVVTHVVQRAFRRAGIDIKDKKFGPHSLRHTLGFRMLQESIILPVISEVLGHESTESTRYYLRIDLKSMQQCMLEVPSVAIDFYMQKGGVFYE